ncbi:hypothetical protein NX786_09075 [Telluria mixta]|uniref:Uncharacterized protein n=1 Tax=Telluria mixta TaxID=34071 RepID=A0ABT2BWH2_9BURK|nr:hypothetical protein [Telluria mixta]MCS0629484.1 hypothetical protein [Telluria mixta]WEM96941.1 hypothetical protein P0M04_04135 [Telluria mixta]
MFPVPIALRVLCAAICVSGAAAAHAVCLDGKPSIEQEFRASAIVALGVAGAGRDVSATDDAAGIDRTTYTVRLTRIFKGAPAARTIELVSPNTSARFPLEPGVAYLLFVEAGQDGAYVDNCGWSGAVRDKETGVVLQRVEAIAVHARRTGSR